MTMKILKSAIAGIPDFPGAAAAHAVEMKHWRAHMQRVKDDEANGVTGIDKHMPHPRPNAHPIVESAVDENDELDFEIVDDGPTPEQILAAKKAVLLRAVGEAEQLAKQEIVPPGKARLLDLREFDIMAGQPRVGMLKKVAVAVGLASMETFSPEDQKHLDEQADRRQRMAAVDRQAAQAMHDIENLTLETIDAWKMPTF